MPFVQYLFIQRGNKAVSASEEKKLWNPHLVVEITASELI